MNSALYTYGREVWEVPMRRETILLATEKDFLTREHRVDKTVTVGQIRGRTKRERTIIEEIRRRQWMWYGRVNRKSNERLSEVTREWAPTGILDLVDPGKRG